MWVSRLWDCSSPSLQSCPDMGTTVSVALCTFNGARWIEEQLRSILGQTLLPDEIVVSDDRSTDATLTVLTGVFDSWTAEHPDSSIRLLVMSSDVRRGVTANFERSILATTGDLVALCDQDDVWHPDRLQQIVTTFARRRRLLLLHGDARIVDEAGIWSGATLFETLEVTSSERSAVSGGRGYDALLRRNLVTGATTVLRRELVAPFPRIGCTTNGSGSSARPLARSISSRSRCSTIGNTRLIRSVRAGSTSEESSGASPHRDGIGMRGSCDGHEHSSNGSHPGRFGESRRPVSPKLRPSSPTSSFGRLSQSRAAPGSSRSCNVSCAETTAVTVAASSTRSAI